MARSDRPLPPRNLVVYPLRRLDAEVSDRCAQSDQRHHRKIFQRDSRAVHVHSGDAAAPLPCPTEASRARFSKRLAGRRATPGSKASGAALNRQPASACFSTPLIRAQNRAGPENAAAPARAQSPAETDRNALYLTLLSRYPSDDERARVVAHVTSRGTDMLRRVRRRRLGLVNSAEFSTGIECPYLTRRPRSPAADGICKQSTKNFGPLLLRKAALTMNLHHSDDPRLWNLDAELRLLGLRATNRDAPRRAPAGV